MSIHENLPPQAREELDRLGWPKESTWPNWHGGTGRISIVQPGCSRPLNCRRMAFSRRLSGSSPEKSRSPGKLSTSRCMRARFRTIDRAIETATLMLASDRSRGYCLEVIGADFLAGANLYDGDPQRFAVFNDQVLPLSVGSAKQVLLITSVRKRRKRHSRQGAAFATGSQRLREPAATAWRRDSWHCQSLRNHVESRSSSQRVSQSLRDDSELNLITL